MGKKVVNTTNNNINSLQVFVRVVETRILGCERRELKERIVELFDVIGQPKDGYFGEENDG
jgi:hypothetical protein